MPCPGPSSGTTVVVQVPAKINLHLAVGPERPDGFHELRTVFHAVHLMDEVRAGPADGLSVSVTGRGADGVPTDARNLAWRAAELLAGTAGIDPDVHLAITKDIPVAGGMAGGSADAAATLVACNRLWGLGLDAGALAGLAARLGSDVAFPLVGGTALGSGRGEVLEPVPCPATLHWVLASADFGIPAGAAYRELDRQRAAGTAPRPLGAPDALVAALGAGDPAAVGALLGNDLQAAALALAPSLRATLDTAAAVEGVLGGLVSGSGPTCAFLCAGEAAASRLAAALEAAGTCAAARATTGPVPGASVVGTAG